MSSKTSAIGDMEGLLAIKEFSLMIVKRVGNSKMLIGVPHHAPGGTTSIPCSTHPQSDENAGYIGAIIAEKLNCSFICACNYFIDPNKTPNTDYSVAISQNNPKYLIEIHGHAGNTKNNNDIEISCGSQQHENDAILLQTELERSADAKAQQDSQYGPLTSTNLKIEGRFSEINLQAKQTATIQDKRWKSFHIELPRRLRIIGSNQVPKIGIKFAEILADAIQKVCV